MNEDFVKWGKSVLDQEAHAIQKAKENLGESFSRAATILHECSGKVVVCGMGKSGHVGKKLAATFSSTGTPSFFLHPSEALHGDLGMVTEQDALLLIAYSGETSEVIEVAKFARRHSIPIVSISGNINSSLAKHSLVCLDGKVEGEADSLGLAPTSSSTLALALGDALAVALMRAKGFSEKDFAKYHPGGKLGKQLSLVEDYMRKVHLDECLTIKANFHDALEAVTKNNYGISAVIDDENKLIGAVTDGDIRRLLLTKEDKALKSSVAEFMAQSPKTVKPDFLAVDAVDVMNEKAITSLFVLNDLGSPVGILRMHDLLAEKVI
jgi:arabinose-5-phosphate isomerase